MEKEQPTCADKITYETEREARAAIAAQSYHYKKPNLSVYRCKECGLFHVTRRHED